jgi:glutamate dehydrogenase
VTGAASSAVPTALLDRLEEQVGDGRRELARDFAEAVLQRIPADQVDSADPDALASELAEAFRFIAGRAPGELAIRTFDPEVAIDGWSDPGTVVEVAAEDRPFLVASIREEIARLGYQPARTFHPIIGVDRAEDGDLLAISAARGAQERESLIHVELDRRIDQEAQDELCSALQAVLGRVVLATDDFEQMRQRVERLSAELHALAAEGVRHGEPEEVAALLDWTLDDNFVLLGCRDYELADGDDDPAVRVRPGSELGILRDERSTYAEPVPLNEAEDAMRERFAAERLLTVNRSHRYSAIRQRTRLLNVWVKRLGEDGEPVGQFRLVGLFARRAHAVASSTVPVIRRKLDRILEREDVVEQSYDERALIALFHAIPLDELFEIDVEELRNTIVGLFAAEEQREIGIFRSVDDASGNVSIIVSVPRDHYDPTFRRRVQDLLRERYGSSSVDVDISLGERPEAIARFSLHLAPGEVPEVSLAELREEIRALARTWFDELEAGLVSEHGEASGRRLAKQIGQRLPATYREHTPVEHAVGDVEDLGVLLGGDEPLTIRFHPDPRPEQALTRLKVLKVGESIVLSRILPIFESLGLTVAEELPFRLDEVEGEPPLHVHDYGVHLDGDVLDIDGDGARLATAISSALDGELETDSLNRLVLHARLTPDDVTLLRAYRRFRRQVGTVYTADYQNDALVRNPQVARELVEHFVLRFDPDLNASEEELQEHRGRLLDGLDDVERLDEDRILRDFLALMDATLRTNRYLEPRPRHLALKFDSRAVPNAPAPLPKYEVMVYSPHMEGIHLRGAAVSRGGIRWSDRRDDYRSEVLDLMQAQMLKNSLIVPDGAKGAFVIKPSEARGSAPSSKDAYEVFIRALLEVTDNVVGTEVVTPERVRRADGDDPYLVVAADRGTATFSDLANRIAEEHGFWLGDAFASGGSRGYDHKRLGITARGAWVAVERHFRELGIDIATEPITVAGIGDMSGDVFGNAMLLSRALKLVAAFDHRDIFIDPDPDPERAFTERERLFGTPGTTWQDYQRELLSEGGGVWSRDEKAITLSEEARGILRIDAETVSPPELIRAILRAPVDLLFAGGIGTFAKGHRETHDEVGDRVNAELRVNGADLRARVVGEGANLALTQRARIEYARRGGRVNTDFIDNAAGVDISDREVNLKILLGLAVEEDLMTGDERDELLAAVSDDVVERCLDDVERQTWALYQEAQDSPGNMGSFEALMSQLERRGVLDRAVESLPDAEEMDDRHEVGAGLTRPELAVILAATKRDTSSSLLDSAIPDEAELRRLLAAYFPHALLDRCGELVADHRLRRELVATELSNEVIDRMGLRFLAELGRELGADYPPIVASWWISQEVIDAERHWATIDRLDREGHPELALAAKSEVDELLRTVTREYLRSGPVVNLRRRIEEDRAARRDFEPLVAGRSAPHPAVTELAERLADAGVEPAEAALLASVRGLAIAPDVASITRATGVAPAGVATAFLALEDALGLDRLRRLVDAIEAEDRWADWQRSGLTDDLHGIHRVAVHRALTEHPEASEREAADRFVGRRSAAIRHATALGRQLEQEPSERRLDALSVAVRAVRDAIRAPDQRP